MIRYGEYKGFPLFIVAGPQQREGVVGQTFQFGKTKAKILLAEMQEQGPDKFANLLADFIAKAEALKAKSARKGIEMPPPATDSGAKA
jgi:hypothetical protein